MQGGGEKRQMNLRTQEKRKKVEKMENKTRRRTLHTIKHTTTRPHKVAKICINNTNYSYKFSFLSFAFIISVIVTRSSYDPNPNSKYILQRNVQLDRSS